MLDVKPMKLNDIVTIGPPL